MAEMTVNDFKGSAYGRDGVNSLKDVAKSTVYERERTKRILILTVASLFIAGAMIMVFSPEGKETVAYILGAVLLILALGAIGVSGFLLRLPVVELDTRSRTGSVESQADRATDDGKVLKQYQDLLEEYRRELGRSHHSNPFDDGFRHVTY